MPDFVPNTATASADHPGWIYYKDYQAARAHFIADRRESRGGPVATFGRDISLGLMNGLSSTAQDIYGTIWLGGAIGFTALLGHIGAALMTLVNDPLDSMDQMHGPSNRVTTSLWTTQFGSPAHVSISTTWHRTFGVPVKSGSWHIGNDVGTCEWRFLL